MAIDGIDSLRNHLQWAIQIEHATIPPYMCALYSIQPQTNTESAEILKSILMEEMLHMCLIANLLNAIGGKPRFAYPEFIAQYPAYLPHSDDAFQVPLQKFTRDTITRVFMRIEKPAPVDAPAEDEHFETLGQFYDAILESLQDLVSEMGETRVFCGDPALQVGGKATHYEGSGRIIEVTDLQSARRALSEVIEQGEGMDHRSLWDGDRNMFHHERGEVGHYFRLQEIVSGRRFQAGDTAQTGPTGAGFDVDWDAVYNMHPNPRRNDHPTGSEAWRKLTEFCQGYSQMLRLLEQTYHGKPELLASAVGVMYELREVAGELMQMPSEDGDTTVGLCFEYLPEMKEEQTASSGIKKIVIRKDGPYIVHGEVPLFRKQRVASDQDESLAWRKTAQLETTGATYALCRCGHSETKPFCDGSHARVGFDGTETAAINTIADRQEVIEGEGITVKCDGSLCMHARFCFNRYSDIKKMVGDSTDIRVRTQMMGMMERCPSGTYSYSIDVGGKAVDIEPDLPEEISILDELDASGPLWVSGNIPVERSDGRPLELRNRVTLCRCGQSKNKPFCDGTHHAIKFKE